MNHIQIQGRDYDNVKSIQGYRIIAQFNIDRSQFIIIFCFLLDLKFCYINLNIFVIIRRKRSDLLLLSLLVCAVRILKISFLHLKFRADYFRYCDCASSLPFHSILGSISILCWLIAQKCTHWLKPEINSQTRNILLFLRGIIH